MLQAFDRNFPAQLDCHYLLQIPDLIDEQTPLVVALHGFSGNPDGMLRATSRLFEKPPLIASVQGPYQFFLSAAVQEVGYGWITNRHASESIRLHHQMISHVLDEVGSEFAIPVERRLLVGFSQSVALNYRFASAHANAVRGVIAICGGLPSDWDNGQYEPVRASVLHVAGRQDDYYKLNVTEGYPDILRRHAADVEFHVVEGGHRMPSAGSAIVTPWITRVISTRTIRRVVSKES